MQQPRVSVAVGPFNVELLILQIISGDALADRSNMLVEKRFKLAPANIVERGVRRSRALLLRSLCGGGPFGPVALCVSVVCHCSGKNKPAARPLGVTMRRRQPAASCVVRLGHLFLCGLSGGYVRTLVEAIRYIQLSGAMRIRTKALNLKA